MTGIPSIKTPLSRACRNHYLDFRCTIMAMTDEMIP